jgi:hypothetical protein
MARIMLSRTLIASAFVLGMAAPALADSSSCSEPYPPAAIDGNTVTYDQLKAAAHDANVFMKASDDYQSCLNSDYMAQAQAAAKSKDKDKRTLDPSIKADVEAKIGSNQKEKEKVGTEFQAAVAAFKAKHPDQKM